MPLRYVVLAALLIATESACAHTATTSNPPSAGTPSSSVSKSLPSEADAPAPAIAHPAPRCQPQDGRVIEISSGTITCADAYATAARYDLQGEKYQHIEAFTCYTGTAQTAPVFVICSSGTTEFSVSHA